MRALVFGATGDLAHKKLDAAVLGAYGWPREVGLSEA